MTEQEKKEQVYGGTHDISGYLEKMMQEHANRTAALNAAKDKVRQVRENGGNMMMELMRKQEPQRDINREERTRRAAKVNAWTNMLTALGTGIVGLNRRNGAGYVPHLGNSATNAMITDLNRLEDDYLTMQRDWQRLSLGAEQQRIANNIAAAEADEREAAEQYNKSLANIYNAYEAEQERIGKEALEDVRHRNAMAEIEARNAGDIAGIRERNAANKEIAKIRTGSSGGGSAGGQVAFSLKDGNWLASSKDLSPTSVNALYAAMVDDDPELAAKGRPIYGDKDIKTGQKKIVGYNPPSLEEKRRALAAGIQHSPSATQLLQALGGEYGTKVTPKTISDSSWMWE